MPSFKRKLTDIGEEAKGNQSAEDTTCMVCMEHFDDRDSGLIKSSDDGHYVVLRRLLCFHQFHKGCIDKWLLKDPRCPLCQTL